MPYHNTGRRGNDITSGNTGGSIKITVKPPETIYRPRNCQNITITAPYIQKLLLLLQAINFS